MHIALVNAFPTKASTAEVEYIRRFKRVAEAKGHHVYEVVTSDDIHCCAPDFVIATHEYTPKLTPYFTLGALWSPPAFYSGDPLRIRSILSYDGYLIGSPEVGQFLDDLEFSTGVHKPRSDFLFLPTAPATAFEQRGADRPYELVYVGVHWDGKRHAGLLDQLHASGDIAFYGPAENWRGYDGSYRGEVPYDGLSMQATLARHGIALCVHKDDHRAADTPSMRLFEAAAAGCLIITDDIPFARRILGDSVFHLDLKRPADVNAARVREIIAWANANRAEADAMARRSHEILERDFSLETTFDRCCDFVAAAKEAATRRFRAGAEFAAASTTDPDGPIVDIVVRTGGRSLAMLRRALRSVADQTVGRYRVILVDYKGRDDVAELARTEQTERVEIDYLRSENTGLRSTSLWAGLARVTAPYFAMLDDDDALMPDHFGHLLATAREQPGHPLYYSGVVRVEEDPVEFMHQPNFLGPMDLEIPELRELKFMERFDLIRLLRFENFVQSNAWIARSSCLDERTLVDPKLVVAEDMYLYAMLVRGGAFRLSPSPTAYWNWRSASLDNSMHAVDEAVWLDSTHRVCQRLDQETMPGGYRFNEARAMALAMPLTTSISPVQPVSLRLGEEQALSRFASTSSRASLHEPEETGVWIRGTSSEITIKLEHGVTDIRVELGFMAAGARDRPQALAITVNDELLYQGPVETWRPLKASNAFHFARMTHRLVLKISAAYAIMPTEEGGRQDAREISVFLSSITCLETETKTMALNQDSAA